MIIQFSKTPMLVIERYSALARTSGEVGTPALFDGSVHNMADNLRRAYDVQRVGNGYICTLKGNDGTTVILSQRSARVKRL